jgi:hypothetical protein
MFFPELLAHFKRRFLQTTVDKICRQSLFFPTLSSIIPVFMSEMQPGVGQKNDESAFFVPLIPKTMV